jgi:tRNA pseudouridine55 synthase
MYSAKKVKGKKLYELARKGKTIKRKPSNIVIHDIELMKYNWPLLKIKVNCSSGTYIRSLAYDIGNKLSWNGYLKNLQRTKVGDFNINDSVDIKNLNSKNWQDYLIQN